MHKLRNVITFANNRVSNKQTFGEIHRDSAFQTIIGQKIKMFDEDIERYNSSISAYEKIIISVLI